MSFAYYGAKHMLAPKYPPPALATIIEPFAGSAAYATYWATDTTRVILVEKDPQIAQLWRDLQTDPMRLIDQAEIEIRHARTTSPLLVGVAGLGIPSNRAVFDGRAVTVTSQIRKGWGSVRVRLLANLHKIARWEIIEGDYTDAPDIRGTWFIDPPYRPIRSTAGDGYRHGADAIDYPALGTWCQSRRGQVIVCEQEPADWLPFRRLARQHNDNHTMGGVTDGVEVIWSRTPGRMLATPTRARSTADAKARRSAVRKRRTG